MYYTHRTRHSSFASQLVYSLVSAVLHCEQYFLALTQRSNDMEKDQYMQGSHKGSFGSHKEYCVSALVQFTLYHKIFSL